MSKKLDLTNKKFGRLTALKKIDKNKFGKILWDCECECGNHCICIASELQCGKRVSCGCGMSKTKSEIYGWLGMGDTNFYKNWQNMRNRCYKKDNKAYNNYGGRGIKICDEWIGENGFNNFYNWAINSGYNNEKLPSGYNKLTLDRIDNSKDYSPKNCRWVTRNIQQLNTRRNHRLTFNGKTQTIKEWSDELGLPFGTISSRINTRKWSPEKALSTPLLRHRIKVYE